MIFPGEIRVAGKWPHLRERSMQRARGLVMREGIYLIRRHGFFFRPGAHGYTPDIAEAGHFSGREALAYLDAEGVSVIPVRAARARLNHEIKAAKARIKTLRAQLAAIPPPPARKGTAA